MVTISIGKAIATGLEAPLHPSLLQVIQYSADFKPKLHTR